MAATLYFEKAEYQDRVARTKKAMAEAGIDVLLVNDPANMCWLSGYDGWSYYTPQLLIVAQDHDEPIWVGRGMDANCGHATCWTKAENIVGYPDYYVQSTERHPMDWIAQFITGKGWAAKVMGVEMDSYFYSHACHASLLKGLPDARFKNAQGLVNWARVVKSKQEIAYMERAARLVEKAMRTAVDNVAPGNRQCDTVGEILHAQISGTKEFGGDYPAIMPLLPTGEGMSAPHLTWSDERFAEGNGTVIEIAGCCHRYHAPLARTVYLGKAPQQLRDAAKVVVDGLNAAIEAAKPGATAEDVEGAWRRSIARSGIKKESRIGYSIGLNYPPDWGEKTISLRPGDRTELRPGMALHCIPGVWLDGFGVEISESLVIAEKGARVLADFPRQLFVKD